MVLFLINEWEVFKQLITENAGLMFVKENEVEPVNTFDCYTYLGNALIKHTETPKDSMASIEFIETYLKSENVIKVNDVQELSKVNLVLKQEES